MRKYNVKVKLFDEKGLTSLFGEPVIFHCNHYNLYLQRTIEDAGENFDVNTILVDGATSSVYSMLKNLFEKKNDIINFDDRLEVACNIYSQLGFGVIDLKNLTKSGGIASSPVSHYSMGWQNKWGKRNKPADYFTCGYIEAALAAAQGLPAGQYSAIQDECISMGAKQNTFTITKKTKARYIKVSPGLGATIPTKIYENKVDTNVNMTEITKTVRTLPLEGNDDGLIIAFGLTLTRHFANYYNYISFEVAHKLAEHLDAEELANELFIEAGHICAFNTLGGIMESDEWYGLVEPQCKNKEDWVSGIVAVANALGWGYWWVDELTPSKTLTIRAEGSYESNGYLGMYGGSEIPRNYLLNGGVAGIMNLIYNADISTKPKLTEEYYAATMSAENSFVGIQNLCRSTGDEYCEISAKRLNN